MTCRSESLMPAEICPAHAVARTTDPQPSHAAAASLTVDRLSAARYAVYWALREWPGLTDAALVDRYHRARKAYGWPQQTDSGIRTRRQELHRGGLLRVCGEVRLPSGRMARRWEVIA